jgi:ABC-type antimicrobial peptide transport system permease subunit
MVLGAQRGQVIWLFLKRSLVQLAVGLTIGLASAIAGGRLLTSFLVQTSSYDPITLVTIVILLTLVAIAACVGPALRATRLDPLNALRE